MKSCLVVAWLLLHRLEATALNDGIFFHRLEVDAQQTPLYNEDILKRVRMSSLSVVLKEWGWLREDGVFGFVVK